MELAFGTCTCIHLNWDQRRVNGRRAEVRRITRLCKHPVEWYGPSMLKFRNLSRDVKTRVVVEVLEIESCNKDGCIGPQLVQ